MSSKGYSYFRETVDKLHRILRQLYITQLGIPLDEYETVFQKSTTVIRSYPFVVTQTIYSSKCYRIFDEYYTVLIIEFPHKYMFKPIYYENTSSDKAILEAATIKVTDVENNKTGLIVMENRGYEEGYEELVVPAPPENLLDPFIQSLDSVYGLDIEYSAQRVEKTWSNAKKREVHKYVIDVSYIAKQDEYYKIISIMILKYSRSSVKTLLRTYYSRELSDALSIGGLILLEPLSIYLIVDKIDFSVVQDFIEDKVYPEILRLLVAEKMFDRIIR